MPWLNTPAMVPEKISCIDVVVSIGIMSKI